MHWQTSRHTVTFDRVRVMAIVNLTPDSFADDEAGQGLDASAALRRCETALAEGAHLLDLGAESTRPGAAAVPADEQWRRLQPVLQGALTLGVPVSVDTRDPAVMQASLDAGADIINDVNALQAPGALQVLASFPRAGACLMHMKGDPTTMRELAHYGDVVQEVRGFLAARLAAAQAAGIAAERLVLDPGYGFAKAADHSLTLLKCQAELLTLGRPLLVGLSRKGLLGRITGRGVGERQAASVAAALAAVQRGAHLLRVHDVAATTDALAVWAAAERGAL